jgi:hypothetical protein
VYGCIHIQIHEVAQDFEIKVTQIFFVVIFIHLFICVYIVWAISPLLLPASLLFLPTPSLPGRTCSALFSNFVGEKT